MSTDEYAWTDEQARKFTAPCVDRWQWDAWLAAHDARVAREALDGLADEVTHVNWDLDGPAFALRVRRFKNRNYPETED